MNKIDYDIDNYDLENMSFYNSKRDAQDAWDDEAIFKVKITFLDKLK